MSASSWGIAALIAVLALALRAGGLAVSSEQDTCILYQKSIRVSHDLQMLALESSREDQSKLESWYARSSMEEQINLESWYAEHFGASWPAIEALILDKSNPETMVALSTRRRRKLHETTNITRIGNDPVVVKVKKDTESNETESASVKANTTDVSVEHKVVKGSNGDHVVDSNVKEKHYKKTKNAKDSNSKTKKGNHAGKGPEKAFAKENITVHKHTLNITRRVDSKHNHTQNVTIEETLKTVTVASSFHIASIYMVLFVPVALAWAVYIHHGQQERHFVWVLPLTMCAMSIGQDLVNQSLTLILQAPNMISAIQGFSMALAMCVWICFVDWSSVKVICPSKYTTWLGVAVLFAVYQLMNHWVYVTCSLSERTVITNLSPVVSLIFERLFMPVALKPRVSFQSKMALSLMVVGAILFSIQSPSFTVDGMCVAGLLLLTTVPYRLAQRQFLAEGLELPLSTLACIDGFVVGVPSVIFSIVRNVHFWSVVETSKETPIFFMLALSVCTFLGLHISGLALLRIGSATSYLVYSNVASLVTVALGIFFFGDQALGTGLACLGLAANVGCGIWYSAEVQTHDVVQQKDSSIMKEDSSIMKEDSRIMKEGANY